MTPRPLPWRTLSVSRRDNKHRYEGCPYYLECLHKAAEAHWNSFTCFFCPGNPLGKEAEGGREERKQRYLPKTQQHHLKGRRN